MTESILDYKSSPFHKNILDAYYLPKEKKYVFEISKGGKQKKVKYKSRWFHSRLITTFNGNTDVTQLDIEHGIIQILKSHL